MAGFWYSHSQKNVYSRETLKLEILGPTEAEAAEEVEYIVKYKNNGETRLEEPRLIFEYPEYSLIEGGKSLREERELKEDIYPGEERTISFKARLFGKEGDKKNASVWLSYRPKNLQARYESATTFTTIIKKVSLVFEFDLPTKIEAGKELRFRLNYFSNIDFPLSNLRCVVEYPLDFGFTEAAPGPTFSEGREGTEWEIGLLNKAEGGRIEIAGILSGEVTEEKIFKAKLGMWKDGEFILLKEIIKGVQIAEPSLYISQQINGNPKYIASPGDMLHYEIFFKNIGQEPLRDMFLIAKLDGKAFDFQTIKAPQGNFEPGDNSIVWDWRRIPRLQFLDAQEEGRIEFWVELKDDWGFSGKEDKNPIIRNKIYLSQAREEFLTRVNSRLIVEQRVYFEDEVFGNSGPVPPRVGEKTTYTVIWQVKNFYNDVKNVKVKTVLPREVKFTGQIFPEDSRLAFDSQSQEMVWELGDLEPGQGVLSEGKSCAFQIALTPTEEQRGGPASLIGQARILGGDVWTEEILEGFASSTDTFLPDDMTMSQEKGIVQ